MGRTDNLKNTHFPSVHPGLPVDTPIFLKIGQAPVSGLEHVKKMLDFAASTAKPPAEEEGESQETASQPFNQSLPNDKACSSVKTDLQNASRRAGATAS